VTAFLRAGLPVIIELGSRALNVSSALKQSLKVELFPAMTKVLSWSFKKKEVLGLRLWTWIGSIDQDILLCIGLICSYALNTMSVLFSESHLAK
jgi:hypothetical protein